MLFPKNMEVKIIADVILAYVFRPVQVLFKVKSEKSKVDSLDFFDDIFNIFVKRTCVQPSKIPDFPQPA